MGKYLPGKRFDPEHGINPFTSDELAQYLAAMHKHYPQHYVYFLCLARTGMREGEVLGLFWDNVQFGQNASDSQRFIHVRRTYDPVHRAFNTPKNGRNRRVDMSQELRAALLDLRDRRFDSAVLQGTTNIPKVVFCGGQGDPLSGLSYPPTSLWTCGPARKPDT
jgi:integrase